jgi:hypothetical protein
MNDSTIIVFAIRNLRPGSEFVFENDDYDTIQWHSLNGNPPTKAEVEAEIAKVKQQLVVDAQEKEAKRTALLDRLGLTEEEAQLLLS